MSVLDDTVPGKIRTFGLLSPGLVIYGTVDRSKVGLQKDFPADALLRGEGFVAISLGAHLADGAAHQMAGILRDHSIDATI